VPEVLELAQFAQHDRPAEMHIGRGGVDAEFDAQGLAAREFGFQFRFGDDVVAPRRSAAICS